MKAKVSLITSLRTSKREFRAMNREGLAEELNVWPWNVDDWLLQGCPAKRIRSAWEFDPEQVRVWLRSEKIKIRPIRRLPAPGRILFDRRWYGKRCPICTERGFSGEKAGRLYTFGEIFEGEWHLRRTGIPCGHSANLNYFEKIDKTMEGPGFLSR
jgi:hypothetical protein